MEAKVRKALLRDVIRSTLWNIESITMKVAALPLP